VSNITRDRVITNVVFGDDGEIEIVFLERHEQQEFAAMMRTLVINCRANKLMAQFDEIIELLEELIDNGYVAVRNPPKTIDPRKRVRSRRPQFDVEVDDDEAEYETDEED